MTYFENIKRAGLTIFAISLLSLPLFFRQALAAEEGSSAAEIALKSSEKKLEQLTAKLEMIEKKQAEILDTVSYLKVRVRKVGR